REYRAEYWKEYGKREEVRARIRERQNLRRKFDRDFFVRARIRRSFGHALSRYSKTGKVASSEKYDMNWKEVIESLKPFPKNLKDFEVDHIIPLHVFDLDDPEQIKMAFSPSNLRWLRREENRKKSGRLVIIGKSEEGFLSIKDTEFENAPMC
ncbi:MAG: HNH endonuclease signature motif containing protein, partial [Candidatus Nanoarchaeia archaeon]